MKKIVRPLVPDWLREAHRRSSARALDRKYASLSLEATFAAIYAENRWGTNGTKFCSGTGSNDSSIVDPYVRAVADFLDTFPSAPDAVDLGCGDFNVGSRVRPYCARYVACDIVPELISHNSANADFVGVEFRHLDIVNESLPAGDIVFLRQVLQHLSNRHIAAVLAKLTQYQWIVLTEHLPSTPGFAPNAEKPAGPGTRLAFESGVVVTAPPFNLHAKPLRRLCQVGSMGGVVETVVLETI